jgi:hypothetical protein
MFDLWTASREIGKSLHKIQKIPLKGLRDETRDDIHILDGLLFMWSVVPSFRFGAILVAAS